MPEKPSYDVVDCHTHFADPTAPKGIVRSELPPAYKDIVLPLGVTAVNILRDRRLHHTHTHTHLPPVGGVLQHFLHQRRTGRGTAIDPRPFR